jgi:hypothetical protein
MSLISAHLRRQRDDQAQRADAAEARALELEAALSDLTRAIGTCKMSTYVDGGMLFRLTSTYNSGGTPSIRAPHDQDPRVQSALDVARKLLGRAL